MRESKRSEARGEDGPGGQQTAPSIGFNLSEFNSTTVLTEKGQLETYENDPYEPFANRQTANPNSTFGALAHLLKSSLGTGILAMPMAFKNAGLIFGAVGTIVVGLLCTHCVHILVKTSHNICKKTKTPVLGFSETAEKVFEVGPTPLRKYSGFAKSFVDIALMATYYGANTVYIVFIATSMAKVCNDYLPDGGWDVRIYILLILLPVILVGQVRELRYLVPFSALANLFIVITFGITLYYMFNEPLRFDDKPAVAPFSQMPLFFATVIFAMEGIGAVMPVENSMSRPQDFLGCPGVLNVAMGTVIVLYAVIGFFGYVRFGDEVAGSITLNLPQGDPISITAQVLIAVAILFTFGLQFFVPMDILWRKIQHRFAKDNHSRTQIILRTGIILIMGAIGVAVPNLDPIISLVGAVFFSVLGILVPAVIETVYCYPNLGAFKWILIKNIVLSIFAIFALVAGSIASIGDIIEEYSGDH